jgi:uncharacterized membrane protein YfcA
MSLTMLIITAMVFTLAGFIKGVIGLGLPTVSVGLLAVAMPPAHALAIVIVPAIITNLWQTFAGPYLRDILRRLWPLMLGTVIGILSGAGLMTGPYARFGTIILGILLVIYAIVGLRRVRFAVVPAHEKWVGGIVGVVTGVVSAATGVQSFRRCRSCRRSAWRRTNWCRRSACSSPPRPSRWRSTSPTPA